jgi:hypothetical protein
MDELPRGFVAESLERSDGAVRVYRAREEHVDRVVTLRVAPANAASVLLDDARRLAGVSHPGLVAVLAAGHDGDRAYVATAAVEARPLGEVGRLTGEDAARVASDVAGAIDALAETGLRSLVSAETVLVASTPSGVRGLLDPLRASVHGSSALSTSEPASSVRELADLVESAALEPSGALRRALAEARNGMLSPSALARTLAPAPPAAPRTRRVAARVWIPACVAVGIVVAAAFALVTRDSDSSARIVPAGRVVASVPLGLPANELPVGVAIIGRNAWIATNAGRLLHIDTARKEVVGTPIALPGKHPLSGMVSDGSTLLTTDYAGWVLRFDPRTAKIVGRRHLATELDAVTLDGNVLWIADARGADGGAYRLDAHTLAPIGSRLPGVPYPRQIVARGTRAWILGGEAWGQVARVDAGSGARAFAWAGPQVGREALSGNTLWLTDVFNGTVSPLSAERMRFEREAVRPARMTMGEISVDDDIWVKTTKTLGDLGPEYLERFDGRTGRRLGLPVAVGKNGQALTYARGSLWIATATTLMRLVPTAGKLTSSDVGDGAPRGSGPRALVAGPLHAGRWRTSLFAAPFTFSTTELDWLAVYPLPDSVMLAGARSVQVTIGVATPRQVFASDSTLVDVRSPAQILQVFQRNPRLRVVTQGTVLVGGHPALRIQLSTRNPKRHPEVCGPQRCVFLFPSQNMTDAITPAGWHELLLLRAGRRTVVIDVEGPDDHGAAEAAAARLLGTVRWSKAA